MLKEVIIRCPGKLAFAALLLRNDFRFGKAVGIRDPHTHKQDRGNPDRCAEPGSDVPDVSDHDPTDEPHGFHQHEKDGQQEATQDAGSGEIPMLSGLFPVLRRKVRTVDHCQGKKAHIAHNLQQRGKSTEQIKLILRISIGIVIGFIGLRKEACHKG